MRQFEFRTYEADEHGWVASDPYVSIETFMEKSQAVRHAGKLCKGIRGHVDLAHAGPGDWDERYITTAMPASRYSKGYRTERLS